MPELIIASPQRGLRRPSYAGRHASTRACRVASRRLTDQGSIHEHPTDCRHYMIRIVGFEPTTSRTPGEDSARLSYTLIYGRVLHPPVTAYGKPRAGTISLAKRSHRLISILGWRV
jgi:hypothetical protein